MLQFYSRMLGAFPFFKYIINWAGLCKFDFPVEDQREAFRYADEGYFDHSKQTFRWINTRDKQKTILDI
jgi:hypothetical protein